MVIFMTKGMVPNEMIAATVKVVVIENRSLSKPKVGSVSTEMLKFMVIKSPFKRAGWSESDSLTAAKKSGVVAKTVKPTTPNKTSDQTPEACKKSSINVGEQIDITNSVFPRPKRSDNTPKVNPPTTPQVCTKTKAEVA